MKRQLGWGLVTAALAALALPIAGGALAFAAPAVSTGQSQVASTIGDTAVKPPPPISKNDPVGTPPTVKTPTTGVPTTSTDRPAALIYVPGNGCAAAPTAGSTGSAPSKVSPKGVLGTSTVDLMNFAQAFNTQRVAHCLTPIPFSHFKYDSCMEQRLFWMAEDPSTNPASAWGHIGTVRSDGVPSVGCDGNLAGGMNNTGATVALKWWDSTSHRTALYKPTYTGSLASVCIYYAVTHGGVPNEPVEFARAAARWGAC